MRMTTIKLVLLRLFMITLGRWGWCARLFKRFMVQVAVVRRGEDKYVATSRYFTWDQLNIPPKE